MGLDDEVGLLAQGGRRIVFAWDEKLMIKRVWRNGQGLDAVSDYGEIKMECVRNNLWK